MANNHSVRLRDWSSRLDRFRQSTVTLAQFCRDEKVSITSFYYWRKRIPSSSRNSKATASPTVRSNVVDPSGVRFTIHAGTIKIECQAESMQAIEAVLAWASRNQDSKFQQLVVQA